MRADAGCRVAGQLLRLLARDVRLRWQMGAAGHRRVTTFYQRRDMLARYRALYTGLIESAERT